MKKYEKDLKNLLEMSDNGCNPVHEDEANIPEIDQRRLEAKGLICRQQAGDNKFWLFVEDKGITYFEDKKDKWINYCLNNWISLLALLVAVVSLIRTF